jgi:hypothetical protein
MNTCIDEWLSVSLVERQYHHEEDLCGFCFARLICYSSRGRSAL